MVDSVVNAKHNNAKNKGKKVKQEADELATSNVNEGDSDTPKLDAAVKRSQMIEKLLTKLTKLTKPRKVHSIMLSLSVMTIRCLLVK